MQFSSNEEKAKWIKDYVDRETTLARMQVQDAETAIRQEQEDIKNAEKAGSTNKKPEKTYQEMLNAIRDGLNNLASSDNEEEGEDEDDDEGIELGNLFEDNEPGWAMGILSKTVHHRMGRFRQTEVRLAELMQPG